MTGTQKDDPNSIYSKITQPITWDSQPFCNVIDLKEEHYENAIKLIKHHYFYEEPMCKSAKLADDSVSVQAFTELVRAWMKDTMSIVALSTRSGRVIGTIIARLNSQTDKSTTFSRLQVVNGVALDSIRHLKHALVKEADVFNVFEMDTLLRIYIFCVHPSYRKTGVDIMLMDSVARLALRLNVPLIGGIFTSGEGQEMASSLGYHLLAEIPYARWIVDDEVVFDDPGIGNYSAAFMAMLTPTEEEQNRRLKIRTYLWNKQLLQMEQYKKYKD